MNLARTRYVIGQPGLKAISLLVLLKKFPGSYFFKTLFQLTPPNGRFYKEIKKEIFKGKGSGI